MTVSVLSPTYVHASHTYLVLPGCYLTPETMSCVLRAGPGQEPRASGGRRGGESEGCDTCGLLVAESVCPGRVGWACLEFHVAAACLGPEQALGRPWPDSNRHGAVWPLRLLRPPRLPFRHTGSSASRHEAYEVLLGLGLGFVLLCLCCNGGALQGGAGCCRSPRLSWGHEGRRRLWGQGQPAAGVLPPCVLNHSSQLKGSWLLL